MSFCDACREVKHKDDVQHNRCFDCAASAFEGEWFLGDETTQHARAVRMIRRVAAFTNASARVRARQGKGLVLMLPE